MKAFLFVLLALFAIVYADRVSIVDNNPDPVSVVDNNPDQVSVVDNNPDAVNVVDNNGGSQVPNIGPEYVQPGFQPRGGAYERLG